MQNFADLGQRLKERLIFRRNALGLTQDDLAERSGVSLRSVSNYEGGALPTLDQLAKLADALGVEPAYFLGATIEESDRLHDQPGGQAAGVYSHLETETLMKSLADLSGKLSKVAITERKYLIGNIRAILDELEEREMQGEPTPPNNGKRSNSAPTSDAGRLLKQASASSKSDPSK